MIAPVYLFICLFAVFLAVYNVARLGYWMFTPRMKRGLTRGWLETRVNPFSSHY